MELTLIVSMDNEAFEDPHEIGRILRSAATKLDEEHFHFGMTFSLWDANGNKVGKLKISE